MAALDTYVETVANQKNLNTNAARGPVTERVLLYQSVFDRGRHCLSLSVTETGAVSACL